MTADPRTLPPVCECTWSFHQGQPCPNPPFESPGIWLSPPLCVPCLHVCAGEREDLEDAAWAAAHPAEVTE